MKNRTRERGRGLDISGDLTSERDVWDWNVRWDRTDSGEPPTGEELAARFEDFQVGAIRQHGRGAGKWYVANLDARETDARDFFTVSQEWLRIDENADPFKRPLKWLGAESGVLEVPAYRDANGRPLQTAAGEPILGLTRKVKTWRFTAQKWVAGIPTFLSHHAATVNKDTVRIGALPIPPTQLSLQRIQLGEESDRFSIAGRKILARPLTMELWWNTEGWTTQVLNAGFYELQEVQQAFGNGTRRVKIPVRCQNNGQDTQKPVMLDRNGARPRDKDGNVKVILEPSDIVVLEFLLDESRTYAPLLR